MISARTRGASKHLLDPEAGAARADLRKPFSGLCKLNKILDGLGTSGGKSVAGGWIMLPSGRHL
jgi:hypothetical protein